jgi:hypothetical protein
MYTFEELEHMDEVGEAEVVLDYNDFKVYRVEDDYFYFDPLDHEVRELDLVASIHIDEQYSDEDLVLGSLEKYGLDNYEFDVSGEAFYDPVYMYFTYK